MRTPTTPNTSTYLDDDLDEDDLDDLFDDVLCEVEEIHDGLDIMLLECVEAGIPCQPRNAWEDSGHYEYLVEHNFIAWDEATLTRRRLTARGRAVLARMRSEGTPHGR